MRRISHALIHPALTARHGDTLLSTESIQRDNNLVSVAATHSVGNDVDLMAGIAQVNGRLRDADVGFDSDEGDFCVASGQLANELGYHHGELGLVDWGGCEVRGDRWDGWAELGGGLSGAMDRDVGCFGEVEELLSSSDSVETALAGVYGST